MIEFDCEGCGVHVYGFGRDTVPASHMCAVCEWLCEHVPDPEEMMAVRRWMEAPAGKPAPSGDSGGDSELPPGA